MSFVAAQTLLPFLSATLCGTQVIPILGDWCALEEQAGINGLKDMSMRSFVNDMSGLGISGQNHGIVSTSDFSTSIIWKAGCCVQICSARQAGDHARNCGGKGIVDCDGRKASQVCACRVVIERNG